MLLDDQQWRALVGPDGVLRPGAMSPPPLEDAFAVFGSDDDSRIAIGAWSAHAERFFATRLGLTSDKTYGPQAPVVDAARFVVAPEGEAPGVRLVYARPCDAQDLAFADVAEARSGGGGLVLLARRCKTVWLVTREGADDRLALRLATILASILLGPVLDVRGPDMFGVKTARAKLEAQSQS